MKVLTCKALFLLGLVLMPSSSLLAVNQQQSWYQRCFSRVSSWTSVFSGFCMDLRFATRRDLKDESSSTKQEIRKVASACDDLQRAAEECKTSASANYSDFIDYRIGVRRYQNNTNARLAEISTDVALLKVITQTNSILIAEDRKVGEALQANLDTLALKHASFSTLIDELKASTAHDLETVSNTATETKANSDKRIKEFTEKVTKQVTEISTQVTENQKRINVIQTVKIPALQAMLKKLQEDQEKDIEKLQRLHALATSICAKAQKEKYQGEQRSINQPTKSLDRIVV